MPTMKITFDLPYHPTPRAGGYEHCPDFDACAKLDLELMASSPVDAFEYVALALSGCDANKVQVHAEVLL